MSKHKKRRLNPIAEANARRQKSIWTDPRSYGIFAIGTIIGVGVIPAVADNTNPFGAQGKSLTTSETTTINSATQGGQQSTINNAFGDGGGQASGAQAGNSNNSGFGVTSGESGGGDVREDVLNSAIACADPNNEDGIRSYFDKVYKQQQEFAVIQVDTDSIFNADPEAAGNEAIAGCFTAADQIIDLAQSIPSITPSWGDIAGVVQTAVNKKLQEVQANMLDRTCQVANRALSDALAPIHGFLSAAGNNQILNDPGGFLGDYLIDKAGTVIDDQDLAFNGIVDGIEDKIQNQNNAANEAFKDAQGKLDQLPNTGTNKGYDTSELDNSLNSAEGGVLQGNLENTYKQLQDVIAKKPPRIGTEGSSRDRTYCKYPTGNQCVAISRGEYSNIANQQNIYNQHLLPAAERRYQLAQEALSASNTGTTGRSIPNYQARSAAPVTNTAPSNSGTAVQNSAPASNAPASNAPASNAPAQQPQTRSTAPQPTPQASEPAPSKSNSNVFGDLF
ncbi:hypothetical protein [Psychrobacter sp. AOP31-A1-22]|uniref:hypothetical protein n=1 Tax=Psychrobacter sp. AOP31-A1-22 TaxID=3457696 RepID=UPI00403511CE